MLAKRVPGAGQMELLWFTLIGPLENQTTLLAHKIVLRVTGMTLSGMMITVKIRIYSYVRNDF